MTTGSGGKPSTGPGRSPVPTPQRMVVRSSSEADRTSDIGTSDTGAFGASDTAVAAASVSVTPGTPAPIPVNTSLGDSRPGTMQMPAAESPAELIGTTLSGRYLVTRKVGQGGMGAVYEATHTLIGKRVAVKVLLEKYAKREAIVQRLEQEARLASSASHEHIIEFTDFGTTDDGRTFLVMEFLEGESLAECLGRESQLPEQRILRIAQQAASALAAAHAKGVVHRDIKPENLFLLKRKELDFIKVVDFGISKSLRASDAEDAPRLTQTGMVLGTPLYMSPEQARGDDDLDHRVDIYALGVIMYEASTGRVPFSGTNYLSVISQVLNESPTPPREIRPDLTDEFEAIVLRAMAKEREDRYANATELAADLGALIDDPTRSTERAKITGPRRKAPVRRNGTKILLWVAGVAVTIAAIAVTVTMTMTGEQKVQKANKPIADAAVVAPPPPVVDAPPPVPAEPKTVKVQIISTPPGAEILFDGRSWGNTPCPVLLANHDENDQLVAHLDGYDDQAFTVNPVVESARGEPVEVKLHKPAKGAPKTIPLNKTTTPKTVPPDAGTRDKTGGELTGNPYAQQPGPK